MPDSSRDKTTVNSHSGYPVSSVIETSSGSYGSCDEGTKIRVRPRLTYRLRFFKKKGVGFVLFWGYVVFVAYNYALREINGHECSSFCYYKAFFFGCIPVFPVVGWFTDIYVGRYRCIKFSILVMWIVSLPLCAVYLTPPTSKVIFYIKNVTFVVFCIGIGVFQANIVQFGVDQLSDSSSDEIMSYISWYGWTYFASTLTVEFTEIYISRSDSFWGTILVLPLLLTLVLCSDFIFNDSLIKEPVTHNPLKLIFRVLQYAWKNKYPRLRSAFSYWDNKFFSRIDLGKTKFGGPFTTEQVEDVKTFFRICSFGLFGCLLLSIPMKIDFELFHLYDDSRMITSTLNLEIKFFYEFGYIFIVAFVPVMEFFIFPFARTCVPYCNIFRRMSFGVILCFLYLLVLLSLDLSGKCEYLEHTIHHANSSMFDITLCGALPSVINCLGVYVVIVTGLEFVCAQSPYSMKGLIFGSVYLFLGGSLALGYGMDKINSLTTVSIKGISICGAIVRGLAAATVLIAASIVPMACYKKRERRHNDDTFDDFSIGTA